MIKGKLPKGAEKNSPGAGGRYGAKERIVVKITASRTQRQERSAENPHQPLKIQRQSSLFGTEQPPPTAHDLAAAFIAEVKANGRGCFNTFRARHGITSVPNWLGAYVRAAAERAGLRMSGTRRADIKKSRGRLCVVWQPSEGYADA